MNKITVTSKKEAVTAAVATPKKIAVTGPYAERDRRLLQAYFAANTLRVVDEDLTFEQARQLERNKLTVLPNHWSPTEFPQSTSHKLNMMIAKQQEAHRNWQTMLAMAIPLFDCLKVDYVLMKALASPFAQMSDIDFLVPQPQDIACIAHELEGAGFALYRFRLLAHPLKIMAVPVGQSIKEPPAIDLYPDAMWIRKHVLDGPGVVARRRKDDVRGIQVWEPCVEDDLYLVATHAFVRGDFMLAELDHGVRLLQKDGFDWTKLIQTAIAFGSLDAIYVYLRLLQQVSKQAGLEEPVPREVLDELGNFAANKALRSWLNKQEKELAFPLPIPLWLGTIRSAVYHLSAVRRQIRLSELMLDAATHGLTVITHLLRRD